MVWSKWISIVLSAVTLALCVSTIRAETVELVNGDTLHGKVMLLDQQHLTLRSELLGELKLPRDRVASITLVARKKPTATQVTPNAGATPGDVLKQLRTKGVDRDALSTLKKQFPLLGTPEVSQYVYDKLSGLMTGRLNLQDIRKDAVRARDQIDSLKKDLGPQADALNGYLSILERFIQETAPPTKTEVEKSTDVK